MIGWEANPTKFMQVKITSEFHKLPKTVDYLEKLFRNNKKIKQVAKSKFCCKDLLM